MTGEGTMEHVNYCHDGKRFVVRADQKLTAFVKLESPIRSRKLNTGTHEQKGV